MEVHIFLFRDNTPRELREMGFDKDAYLYVPPTANGVRGMLFNYGLNKRKNVVVCSKPITDEKILRKVQESINGKGGYSNMCGIASVIVPDRSVEGTIKARRAFLENQTHPDKRGHYRREVRELIEEAVRDLRNGPGGI